MIQKILVPLDFTEKNDAALNVSLKLAGQNDASVHLLHVIESVENLPAEELEDFYNRLETRAREKLDSAGEMFRKNKISTFEEVLYGKRAGEIVQYAAENRIDLIVLSSHRITPEHSEVSLSYQVAMMAECSVLLSK